MGMGASAGCAGEAELQRRRNFIVQTDLLGDLAVLDTQNGGARESHLLAEAAGRQPTRKSQ